jgi:hypothetical protein
MVMTLVLSGCSITNWFLWSNGESGDRDTLPITLNTLIEMGEYSKLIYTDKGIFADGSISPEEPEFYGLNRMIESGYEIRKNEFSYYVMQKDGITILIFRGTANAKNILSDIDIRPFYDKQLNLNLHRGFRDAADAIYVDIKRNYELDHTVYLTGHSLGGAIAQIIGMWLHESGRYNVQVFTYGSPKVSTKFLFNEPNHWRVVDRSDPIPFLPPFPYVHSGVVIDIDALDWSETHEEGDILQTDGLDHSIKDYLDILYNHSECDAKCRGSQEIRD